MTQLIHLDGNSLTLEEVIAVARHGAQCELDEQAKEAVIASVKSLMTLSGKNESSMV